MLQVTPVLAGGMTSYGKKADTLTDDADGDTDDWLADLDSNYS